MPNLALAENLGITAANFQIEVKPEYDFLANPFERVEGWFPGEVVSNGSGMNPMLQNPGMVFHPLTTYLGYVGFAVPFAYGMTALIMLQAGDEWIKVTRRWTITTWLFLSLGNLFGAKWAYMELGWGVTGAGIQWKMPRFCPGS